MNMEALDQTKNELAAQPNPDDRRRRLLKAAAALTLAAPFVSVKRAWSAAPGDVPASTQVPSGSPKALKLAWSATAICTVPVPVALKKGFFQKYNLDVDFVNFAGSTDQLLEAIASGKADGGVGMALRWLKPWNRVLT